MLGLWANMLHILVLCPVLLIVDVQTLTIDSQLGTSVEDCFERISIGEQLPLSAIYRNVSELTTRECEQICKQDKQCQAYDYGVGAKGNATCDLSTLNEKEVKDKTPLTRHPDFDIYVRRFQCEQSPPSPIQTLLDDPESDRPNKQTDRPQHKPVFRPDVEERPLSDDYLVSSDLDPYNSQLRPDDVSNRPNYDVGPSYGNHRPQDIPFPGPDPYRPQVPYRPDNRPIRPGGVTNLYNPNRPNQDPYRPERPQDPYRPDRPQGPYRPDRPHGSYRPERPQDPYKPERPQDSFRPERPQNPYEPEKPQHLPVKPKPDPNDVLQFDDYEKPGYLGKPDPYRPEKPYQPDNYIIKPNRKPRPDDYKPSDPYGSGPIGPSHKPMYSYDSQYASHYGQNDNSVYVEIHDPPRPYIPIKNRPGQSYEQGFLGYGTYSSQNSYNQNSYTGSITEIEHDKPQKLVQKPQEDERPDKPTRPNKGSYPQNDNQGYGYNKPSKLQEPGYQRPNQRPVGNQNYHDSQNSYGNHDPYGGSPSYNQHGSDHSGIHRPDDYGCLGCQKPLYDKPPYGDKGDYGSHGSYGSYGSNQGSYGGNLGSYGGSQGSYLSDNGHGQGSYGSSHGSFGQASFDSQNDYGSQGYGQGSYGNGGSYGSQGYGFNQGIYGGNQGTYNSYNSGYGSHSNHGFGNRPVFDYELHKPGYEIAKPGYDRPKPVQKPLYDKPKPGYGDERPDPAYDSRPDGGYQNTGYGNDRPSHSNDKPSYSNDKPSYGNDKPSYSNDRPISGNDKPSYANDKPSYASDKPSYSNDRPSSGYGKPSYSNDRPSYGNDRPSYGSDRPSYANDKPSYANDRPSYGSDRPSYGSERPSYGHNEPTHGNDKPTYNNDRPSYGNDRPSYDSYDKPNYSHDAQKPTYGNSKPATHRPNYEDEKPQDSGYRPSNSSNRPDVKPVYEYEMDKPTNVPTYIARPGGEVVTSRPVVIGDYEYPVYKDPGMSHSACFRRVLAGRRALRSFVRKVVSCERLEDCRSECALEKRFHCESFNYRLDQSFRGKGLCELMTKPIEAFDQQRDFVNDKNYDFYEVDRNSLEPNCPETLRGPGLLHSGFLSSKPDVDNPSLGYQNRVEYRPNKVDDGWKDRNWVGGYRDRFSFDRNRGGNRRYEDHFVPYQIGQSRTEDNDNWGQYGGNYGGHHYYKDRNDYHKSIDHWGLSSDRPTGVKPHFDRQSHGFDYHSLGKNLEFPLSSKDFHHFDDHSTKSTTLYGYGSWKRGQWNAGSNALDFEDPVERRDSFEPHEEHEKGGNDCYSRRRPGMSLKSGAIRRSLTSRNVVECEAACFEERDFKCVSYSYRYSTSRGSDNCFLSERPYRGLEMSADSGSDVYGMPQDKACAVSSRPWVESECFWHVRSDTAVTGAAVKATLTVAGLGACEAECIRAQGFFCRGFSFRFDSPTIGDEDIHNCILTSSPTTTLARTDTPGHELYARGNFGRGCEPAVYDDTKNGECYLQYDKAAKLTGAAIRGQARVRDEQTCGVACTEAPFRCLSFSYNNIASPSSDNCFLSEIRLFDLKRGVDYVHSVDDWLFAFDLFNSKCWRKVQKEDTSSELPHPIITSSEEIHSSGPSGPDGDPYSDLSPAHPYIQESPSGPIDPSGPSGPTYKPASDYRPYHEIPDKLYPIDEPTGPSGPDKSYPIDTYNPIPDRPSFTPPDLNDPNFRPSEVIIPYKPLYPDPEPYGPSYKPDRPSYKPDRPSYKPDKPSYRPDRPSYRPDGPDYLPDRPNYSPDLPSYRPERPSYRPDGPGFIPDRPNDRPESPSYRPERPSYRPDSPSYRPDSPSYRPDSPFPRPDSPILRPDSPSYRPDRPFRPTAIYPDPGLKPSFGPHRPKPVDRPGYERPEQRPQPPLDLGDKEIGPIETSWRHYTVSGFPCRAGTTCAQNQIVGHWACEPEGGEIGSWDYCCAPTHRCGYSEGFHKPWCYVGHKKDQWRPCSEKYYPYHQHNVPHPSQGQRDEPRPHRPWRETPPNRTPIRNSPWPVKAVTPPPPDYIPHWDKPPGPYLSEADRKYWDDLYEDGPKAYYDKYGNPLPGYSRVPTENRPYIRYKTNDHGPSSGHWIPVSDDRPPVPGLGAPRYWPVAYLHRGPPPNTTYFRYNESKPTTERPKHDTTTIPSRDGPEARDVGDDDGQIIDDRTRASDKNNDDSNDEKARNNKRDELDKTRDEKKINDSKNDDIFNANVDKDKNESVIKVDKEEKVNNSDVELVKTDGIKKMDSIKGIDDKLEDFSKSIEVLDIEDAKSDKLSDLKTLEAEERQIEAIGRLLANRRGSKLVIEKRSQKDLDAKNIAVDQDVIDFNFGNRFPTSERRGVIKRISKDEIERDRQIDKSLEVSETTFVRPPRVLSTTENIRKAIVNGKVFYDATLREQREISNVTRQAKRLGRANNTTPSIINNSNYGKKKIIRTRNTNPVRRVKRVYRKRYNPGEVRRRLLERDRNKVNTET